MKNQKILWQAYNHLVSSKKAFENDDWYFSAFVWEAEDRFSVYFNMSGEKDIFSALTVEESYSVMYKFISRKMNKGDMYYDVLL